VNNSAHMLACPLCDTHFSHFRNSNGDHGIFGHGLDFRVIPRDCNRAADVATCPNCFFSSRFQDFGSPVPGQVKELVCSRAYLNIFESQREDAFQARGWKAYVSILGAKGLNPRDLGMMSLRASWVARETGFLTTEDELLSLADEYLDDALRRGLTKGAPGMVIYLLGEINRRRREFLRAREILTFLGNNPQFRYPALLLTVLIEEEDSTPYWSHYAPDQMERHSPAFKGLFPALRSIPPKKVEFLPDELQEESGQPDEDDRRRS